MLYVFLHKQHISDMKKFQQYSATNNYFVATESVNNVENFEIKDPKLIKLGGYEDISSANLKAK